MVICVLVHRYPLLMAVGRRALLERPLALAPPPGAVQAVGEVSGAAEAYGVHAGMGVAEALSRCPSLLLIPPDPGRAERAWELVLCRLEDLGATVESGRPGEAYFNEGGLRALHGGRLSDVLEATREALSGPGRLGAAPNRFCAYAAAAGARNRRRARVVRESELRHFLAPQPVSLLLAGLSGDRCGDGDGAVALIDELRRLGVTTLGRLARLPADAVADRFGRIGLRAHALACGEDRPLRPRSPRPAIAHSIELPEAASGAQLERALEMLIDRLLGDRDREGRPLRALRLQAGLAGGGSWQADAVPRRPSDDRERLRLVCVPKLAGLPGPAESLELSAISLAPAGGEQGSLIDSGPARRRERIAEAVRQAQTAGGGDAMLRVLDVDPGSRVPERRSLLTPHTPPGER